MSLFKIFIFIFFSISILQSNEKLENVSLQLNWKYQFEFAGFIAAKEKGFYKDVGLDVDIKEFEFDINVIEEIKNKKSTYGIYDLSFLHYTNDEDSLILLANYLKRPALVFVTKQDILTPFDFKNKIIMSENSVLDNSNLGELLKKFNIKKEDFKEIVHHNYKADDFISGKVDIMTIYLSNELFHIKNSKVPFNIVDPSNFGLNSFGLNLISSKDDVLKNKTRTENFINASKKGWEYAFANKEEIAKIIYEKYSKLKSLEALLFEADEIEKLMLTNLYEIGSIKRDLIENILLSIKNEKKDATFNINDFIFEYKKGVLTNEEKNYLKSKKEIKVCIDPDWLPFEKIENHKHIGLTKDFMDTFQEKIEIPINLHFTNSWTKSIESFKNKNCDILSLVTPTVDRLKYMNITKPYVVAPLVIATKNDELFISSLKSIDNNKKVGVVNNYATHDILLKNYPSLNIVTVKNVNEGLSKVLKGEIFGFVDTIPSIGYEIKNSFYGELKIAGKFNEELIMGVGVDKDNPILFSIFEKIVNELSEEEKQKIVNNWVNVKYEKGTDYSLLWKIIIGFTIALLFLANRHKELMIRNNKIEEQRLELEKNNSDLKKAEIRLKQSLQNFENLLSSTMDTIFVIENGICIHTNLNAKKLLEIESVNDIIGKNIFNYFNLDKEDLTNKEPFEVLINFGKEKTKPALLKVNKVDYEKKSVLILSCIDLTELKNKELIFLKQSKMASMGEMIGNIAHQWRQPLSVISAVSTGLKLKIGMGKFEPSEFEKSLDNLNKSVVYLSETIDDFRNFYRSDKEKRYITTKSLLSKNMNLIDTIFKSNNIEISIENEIEDVQLFTYENELLQALVNILNNAKDALVLNREKDRFIFIKIFQVNEFVAISIKDNGGGIPKDIINKIFEPYFTTKHKSNGTGIGLYMTHQIIEKNLDGKIEVKNVNYIYQDEEFIGAEFIIQIPSF